MNRLPPWLFAGAVAVLAAFLLPTSVPAQVFRLGTWEGAAEGTVDFSRVTSKTGSQAASSDTIHTDERLTLRNVGAYIYDPRLATLSLGGTFGLFQERFDADSGSTSRNGTLWGYDAFASVLPEKDYSLNLFANRSQSFLSAPLAGRVESKSENYGATLYGKRLYIPSTVTFRQELREDSSRTGDVEALRKERRDVFSYQGRRGWIDSEMDLQYEFVDSTDEIVPSLSYRSHEGSFGYGLDFGTELNWHWDSRLRAFTRTGAASGGIVIDQTNMTADELLRIDHSEQLRTEYRYLLNHIAIPDGATTSHNGMVSLRHQLYESLTTLLGVDGVYATLPGGTKETLGGHGDFVYTKRLPWEGRLSAGVGAGLIYDASRFSLSETFIPQEAHTVGTPFALPIALSNPFAVTSSVAVTKVAVGPLPVGCIAPPGPPLPLVLGRDYTLRAVGDITEIVPIPCSGVIPGVNPGDTIAVDYRFAVSPSLSFITTSWHVNASADYRWIRPYFSHEQSEQNLLSGRDGRFLDNQRSDIIGTEFRYERPRLRASLLGEAHRVVSHRLSYDSVRSTQYVSLLILPEMTLNLNGNQAFFEYKNPKRSSTALSGSASLTYALNADLFADALAGIQWLKDSGLPSDRTIQASVRVRWFIGKLELNPELAFADRSRGDTDTKEYRAMLHIIRRF